MSLSQTDDSCLEAKSQEFEKMHLRMALLQFILYITIKEGHTGRVTGNLLVVD